MEPMPKLQLTKRNIDKITPPVSGQTDYFDTELKGFALRVSPDYTDKKTGAPMKGAKTFFVQVDVRDPATEKYKSRKAKIGLHGEYTPEQARQKAPDIMKRLREGKPADDGSIPTLRDLYDRYIKDKTLAKTTLLAYKYHIPKFESWLDLPLPKLSTMLTPEVVIDRYQQVLESGSGAAHNAFKCLQSIVNYGAVLYPQHVTGNPVKIISDAKLWTERKAREDCLEPGQFYSLL